MLIAGVFGDMSIIEVLLMFFVLGAYDAAKSVINFFRGK